MVQTAMPGNGLTSSARCRTPVHYAALRFFSTRQVLHAQFEPGRVDLFARAWFINEGARVR
jgi:hypothetical protein